jgi:hypothetical protein
MIALVILGAVFSLSPVYVTVLIGVVLPILVGLITKTSAPAKVKVIANMLLSAAAALITGALNEEGYALISTEMLAQAVILFVVSTASYLGIYKPLEVPERLAPDKGFG